METAIDILESKLIVLKNAQEQNSDLDFAQKISDIRMALRCLYKES